MFFKPRPQANSRRSNGKPRLEFQSLEARQLLAVSVSFDSGTGIVSILGNSANDTVFVVANGATQTQVQYNGNQTVDYNNSALTEIKFWGSDGDDVFQNDTAIKSFFGGHNGNDSFYGGSNDDRVFAGDGTDLIFGRDGNDYLDGGNGNDQLQGGNGNDSLYGWFGNDLIYCGAGDDYVNAAFDNDTVYGEAGADFILGSSGDDTLSGGDGDDSVYGQGGNDNVSGEAGNDRVRGNNGIDQLSGGDGNDYMMADDGDDVANGDGGTDYLFGSTGNDFLDGGDGNDQLFGLEDNDEIHGGLGDDYVLGGSGNDSIYGEDGADQIHGQAGEDKLFGGTGIDQLFGGADDDALFGGGLSFADQLSGNGGQDRFLSQNADSVLDRDSTDAVLKFFDADDVWSDKEIEIMGNAFAQLHDITGNNRLLLDTLSNDDLSFYKYATLDGAAGINWLSSSWTSDGTTTTYTYEREIHIADWDETSQWYNDQYRSVAIHEIGHNWDSNLELSTVSASLSGAWSSFSSQSGWTDVNPNNPGSYSQSTDGLWWYANSAAFADSYGRTSPHEDFSTMWEIYFDNLDTPGNIASGLSSKIAAMDSIFNLASSLM